LLEKEIFVAVEIFFIFKSPHWSLGLYSLLLNGFRCSVAGARQSERDVYHSPHPVQPLIMNGAIPLCPLRAFIVQTETTQSLHFILPVSSLRWRCHTQHISRRSQVCVFWANKLPVTTFTFWA